MGAGRVCGAGLGAGLRGGSVGGSVGGSAGWVLAGRPSCCILLLHQQGEQGPKGDQGDRGPPGEPVSAPRPAPRAPSPAPRAQPPAWLVPGDGTSEGRAAASPTQQEPAEPNVAPSSLGAPRCAPSRGSPLTPRACVHPHPSPRDEGDGSVHHWLVSSAGVTGPSWRPGASRSPRAAGKKTLPAPVGPDPLMPPPLPLTGAAPVLAEVSPAPRGTDALPKHPEMQPGAPPLDPLMSV